MLYILIFALTYFEIDGDLILVLTSVLGAVATLIFALEISVESKVSAWLILVNELWNLPYESICSGTDTGAPV